MTPIIGPEFPELVEKYNTAGPRYTSYPTVPAWKQEFGEAEYCEALAELSQRPSDDLAIYLHLPFCAKACHYCGCNMLTCRDKDEVTRYLDRLEQEVASVTGLIGTGRKVVQFHWGGGTPNFLNNNQVERVLKMFHAAFTLAPNAEVSLEVDPRIATVEQVAFLQESGFNRISLGVQDFDPGVQKNIGRLQSREKTLAIYQGCRDAGFEGVNLDLVYGLPGQTRENFENTLEGVIDLEPDRVACFSYAHVPWVRPNQEVLDTSIMAMGYEKFQLFQLTVDKFQERGYVWIGIDHFAKKDDELSIALADRALHRNFMGYATKPAPHMLAFGMSGIGDVCDRFVQNDATYDGWTSRMDAGGLPVVKGHKLSRDDKLRRLAILNLMCNLELPWELTRASYGKRADDLFADNLKALPPLLEDGLVTRDDFGLRITGKGRYFVRNVAMILDAYLGDPSDKPIFSKTV
ncbi:MAG: oxygen-independent coproporphyrinogen III oxidase [Gemmatimonadales bacterium]|nr:oxygen-independent coproporphyrinogen III oxidase [Gemmatimonadales bacterium]